MIDLFETAALADIQAGDLILAHLADKGSIDRPALNAVMCDAFGGGNADGRWTQRDSFELLEHGVARHLVANVSPVVGVDDVRRAIAFARCLPTQTVRSEDQLEWQQFSTPVDIAALVALLAQANPDDVVLEPSAGNGLLVAQLPAVAALQLNELAHERRRRLPHVFPSATLTGHDGAMLASTMARAARPSLILMNPPFSRSLGLGADALAAVRHLQAALGRLRRGGRLVAIMPDWFKPSAKLHDVYAAVLKGTSVRNCLILHGCYGKHGTGIDVRVYVIDKLEGLSETATLCRSSLDAVLDGVTLHARPACADEPASPRPAVRTSGIGLFRAVKSTPAPVAPSFRAAVANNVLPVAYTALDEPAPTGTQAGDYLPYRPSRVIFDSAGDHPTPLVESVAMGSIAAPIPHYVPSLPERCVSARLLSAAQLETVVYAGDAWTRQLPGSFVPDKEGVGLDIADDGRRYREGYFLGDGTGAGKGRQIAACILDQWLKGRRRAIWVSKNEALLDDARRDWTAIGGLAGNVQSLSSWKIDAPITLDQGVLFVSYPTLRSQRQDCSRLQQLLDWAGPAFDGVIAFDEAHEMGGVAGGQGALGKTKGSLQGIAGVLLQNHLPDARVLYASATGASDINNLAYAVRLGLWGPSTAFATREAFIMSIRAGGIAAMELVARDLKATGRYAARALSFAGVEYHILRHDLTPEQIAIYNIYADAWAIIHRNMESALEITNVVDALENKTLNSGAKAAARSRFESTKQRFFGQVLLSMKLPTVLRSAEAHLAEDKSVVMQLVTTAESVLDRRLGTMTPEERADLDVDLSPREAVIDYLARAFPVRQMEMYVDDTGEAHSRPMSDEAGNPVHNPDAEARRDALIEHICGLPPIKPALDAVIGHFGPEAVAEVTGRTRRIVEGPGGQQRLESRSARAGQADAAAFMRGDKRVLVFSDAGGTGRSYHASFDVLNRQQRVHLLLEPGWRADRAIQGLGRTHRTHQASAPLFRPVTTNCKGELRFTSTIARRLDSLGALTRGQRQTGGQNLFDPADNLESDYAKAALVSWFHLLNAGKLTSTTMAHFMEVSGLELLDSDGVLKEDLPPIQRWLNRLLALRIDLQNTIFDEFLGLVERRIAAARDAGTLDIGVETILVDRATVLEDRLLRTDSASGATTHLLTIEIARKRLAIGLARIQAVAAGEAEAEYLCNTKSGRIALKLPARSFVDEEGAFLKRVALQRPTRCEHMLASDLAESAWESIDVARFDRLWAEEVDAALAALDTETIQLATGLLLPIWSALPSDHLTVNRIADNDGRSWLGRLVFDADVVKLFTKLGIEQADNLPADKIAAAALRGEPVSLVRPFEMTLARRRVNGELRLELSGAPADRVPWLKSLGCFTEIIQYRTRVFVPRETAEVVIAAVVAT
ncbi:strawberry notch family protein [Sphingomonas sp. SUN039]|uniref:strawberry notch family protein n=1 Tax=Sphingomonas sp. SUN039 TaxID=2937787 RepID=UPI0021641213|nr:strawberry notch family protein [Sphingomonas sp. SUN039]UVO53735.1 strawberry notch family protein [Sphingomonas sp. SUN039]